MTTSLVPLKLSKLCPILLHAIVIFGSVGVALDASSECKLFWKFIFEHFAYFTLGHTASWLQDESDILLPLIIISAASLTVRDEIVKP